MVSKIQLSILIIAALSGQSDALAQTPSSRRSFIGRIATTGGAAVVAAGVHPGKASAIGKRGGKETIDATHNGTELNGKESGVASGLLGKMGLDDIAPDKGSTKSKRGGAPAKNSEKPRTH
mmetsp:Transcript_25283/g.38931  ORF Transcript_25283/g.38931 Transcript_25283/m.38931 type:complete len:121 (-) Transcript_25283:329-691(-)|eukprot:CAMPEP_0195286110 /NCGR_PEP_ID=MMETSP0707-20130614/3691_1 /TAXON_ID=33640 /ORGANISM="Asterionellopsis glacialis, Strain CCMP134" /LENGTH=120 /DNA_ID=CAMNT_0040345703 /DNA_START=37 /DNA_END=399 /DNA_ORIENTATION=+